MIEETGGSFGIRDENLLNSALNGIFQTFDGKDLYPTKEAKGAMLGYALISNHAFVDGNKRIGVYVMLTFLEVNGIRIKCTDSVNPEYNHQRFCTDNNFTENRLTVITVIKRKPS